MSVPKNPGIRGIAWYAAGGQALRERFPQVQQITCITIHMNMYGDTGDLLHLREAPRELRSLVIG